MRIVLSNIGTFGDINPLNISHVKQVIYLFGGLDIGLQMPQAWQGRSIWDKVDDHLGSWGGHDVWVVDYDAYGVWCVTWGELQFITWEGFHWACDEAHALIVPDWVPPVGFDMAALKAALALVTA